MSRPRAAHRSPRLGSLAVGLVLVVAQIAAAPVAAADHRDRGPVGSPGERPSRPTVDPGPPAAPRGIIVGYRGGTSAAARTAVRAQAEVTRAEPGRPFGLEVVRPRGRSLAAALRALRADPRVAFAVPDRHNRIAADPTLEPLWDEQWALDNRGQVINGYPGVGNVDVDGLEALGLHAGSPEIVVAVIDDGVDFSHPDLAGQAWVNPGEDGPDGAGGNRRTNGIDDDGNGYVDDVHGWDFCNDDATVHDPGEDWHGTAVASAIAARHDGSGIAGLAPGVRIMALKFLQDEPLPQTPECGYDSQAIAALAYAASKGALVVNASWGRAAAPSSAEDTALRTAVESSNALVVAAAGNAGVDLDVLPFVPAALPSPNVLSVAAIHNQGLLAEFSSYGRVTVDLAAPGEDIITAVPAGYESLVAPGWALQTGTSFAAPFVSATAALAASARTDLRSSPMALRQRVLETGWDLSTIETTTATGRVVDAWWAVTAPTTVAASITPLTGATLGASTVTARITWPAASDAQGVNRYAVDERVNGGPWQTIAVTTTRQLDRALTVGRRHEFRVLAEDRTGAWSGTVVGTARTPSRYQQTSSLVRYGGTWTTHYNASHSGRSARYAGRGGAWTQFRFSGRGVAFVAPKGPTRGSARIYVDGVLVKTVSLYRSTTRYRQVLFSRTWASSGTHTLRVVVVGTRGRPRVDVDAFVVLR